MRRLPRPSQFRFLAGGGVAVLVIIPAFVFRYFEKTLCGIAKQLADCQLHVIPPAGYDLVLLIAVASCCWSSYRAYRNFVVGDYYMDLAEAD